MSVAAAENLRIMAIGGGDREITCKFLKDALDLSGVDKPNVLLIPTARPSQDDFNASVRDFGGMYTDMGLDIETLHDYNTFPSEAEAQEKLAWADVAYISGGDAQDMMRTWQRFNLAEPIAKRAMEGMVLSGISAGAMAPFSWGYSDSLSYHLPEGGTWDYMTMRGLGLLNAAVTPHANTYPEGTLRTGQRGKQFEAMLQEQGLQDGDIKIGYAIDEHAAIQVADGVFSGLSATARAHVVRLGVESTGRINRSIFTDDCINLIHPHQYAVQ